MKKRQGPTKQSPSKVLLICVYDTVIIQVTNQIVFARFSPFGPIIKILIFEKGEVTKFFLQFHQLQHAIKAKNYLDGSKLYESICKMNIYYSNFSTVDLKHETTEGISLESLSLQPTPYYYYPPQASYYNYPYYYTHGQGDQYSQANLSISNISVQKQNSHSQNLTDILNYDHYQKEYNGDHDKNIEKSIQSSIDWLLRSQQKKNVAQKCQVITSQNQQKRYFLQFELKQDIGNKNIYNLFSNFGNISYIKKTKQNVFVKFRTIQFAAMAKNYLHGYKLLQNILNLQSINDIQQALPRQDEYAEITYFDASFDRFTPNKSITINPPSNTIHVSSLRRESCKVDNLKYIFEQFGLVEGVQVLGNNYDKNMALVQFVNIEDSFYAISQMHNRLILGRKIQISFTKSKVY